MGSTRPTFSTAIFRIWLSSRELVAAWVISSSMAMRSASRSRAPLRPWTGPSSTRAGRRGFPFHPRFIFPHFRARHQPRRDAAPQAGGFVVTRCATRILLRDLTFLKHAPSPRPRQRGAVARRVRGRPDAAPRRRLQHLSAAHRAQPPATKALSTPGRGPCRHTATGAAGGSPNRPGANRESPHRARRRCCASFLEVRPLGPPRWGTPSWTSATRASPRDSSAGWRWP